MLSTISTQYAIGTKMKKWYEYQLKHIAESTTTNYAPCGNVLTYFRKDFQKIIKYYEKAVDNDSPELIVGSKLVGGTDYADLIMKKYNDQLITENIHEWCSDPEFRMLLDQPSIDFLDLKPLFPDFCQALCENLGADISYSRLRLQVQRPGYISPLHIDARKSLKDNDGVLFKAEQTPDHNRWIIFMEDWKPGQIFLMGNDFIKWNEGDVMSWQTRDVPHALANIGYWNRYILLLYAGKLEDNNH